MSRVLVVEDDPVFSEILGRVFERAGLEPVLVQDGEDAVAQFAPGRFDVAVLDLMLPGIDGFEICKRIREHSSIPIMVLTGRSDAASIVQALEIGADDYVSKPAEAAVLVARVRALLRRSRAERNDAALVVGPVKIDPLARQVTRDGEPIALSSTEFRLLYELARSAGEVVSRETLLRRVWDATYLGDSRLIDMAVMRLRDKIDDKEVGRSLITTVRGAGYRLERSA